MKLGDIVKERWLIGRTPTPNRALTGMIVEVLTTASGKHEYRVKWFGERGRSRCTRGILEIVSEAG